MPDVWTRSHGCIAGVFESLQPAQRTHSAARTSRAPTPHPARSWRAQADSRTTSLAWKICGSVVSNSPASRVRSSSQAARLISTTGLRMVVEMSRAACELLLTRLAGEFETTEPQIFQAKLVVLESA